GGVIVHQVHVVGQVGPGAGDAFHLRLAAELAFRTHLARHAGHFRSEGVELVDHRVDGVLQFEDLAADVHGDLLGKVAARDRGGHFGDVAHLTGEVRGHEVHVVREVGPGSGNSRHLRLAAELAFRADLARHAGHFGSKAVQLIDHRVDGVLELEDLALHVDGDLFRQVALRHRGRHFGDVADLSSQIVRHEVDVVGQILLRSGDAFDARLAAELAFGADLAGHAGNLAGERVELIHHGVDGVLQFEDFALHLDGDLLRQVAAGDGGGHFGDIADLARQVGRHRVDVVGEVLPGAGDALHLGLAAKLALGAHFAGHAGHFGSERGQLLDHSVHDLADSQEFAAQGAAVDLDRHGLGKIALGDGADDSRDFRGRLDHVVDQLVDGADGAVPPAACVLDPPALADLAFLADDLGEAFELLGHLLVQRDDLVEEAGDLAVDSVDLFGQTHAEVAAAQRTKRADELAARDKVPRGLDVHLFTPV